MEGLGLEEVPVTSPELDELLFSGILESCAAGGVATLFSLFVSSCGWPAGGAFSSHAILGRFDGSPNAC